MSDFSQFLQENGNCCICKGSLKESERLNMGMLDKFITWEHPGWGNILAVDEADRMQSRAVAVICDTCFEANRRKEPVGEIRFAIEVFGEQIVYHTVEDLKDAPPIVIPEEFM